MATTMDDGKDLIYEGIATSSATASTFTAASDGKDLIYEGIAT